MFDVENILAEHCENTNYPLYTFLTRSFLLEKYLKYTKNDKESKSPCMGMGLPEYLKEDADLIVAFSWANTPEGWDYWKTVYLKVRGKA